MIAQVSERAARGRLGCLIVSHEQALHAAGDHLNTTAERKAAQVFAATCRRRMRSIVSAFNGTADPIWPPTRDAVQVYLAAFIMQELQRGQRRARAARG